MNEELLRSEGFKRYRKIGYIWAKPVDKDFVVSTPQGVLDAKAGDYLCIGPGGQRWPVGKEDFENAYENFDK